MSLYSFDDFENKIDIRTLVPEIQIYQHYFPQIKPDTTQNIHPFKMERKSKSFSVFYRNGELLWKDHSNGQFGDVLTFVIRYYEEFHNEKLSRFEVNQRIKNDLKLNNLIERKTPIITAADNNYHFNEKTQKKERVFIQVRDIGWPDWALRYWIETYTISQNTLRCYNVGHAAEVWYTKDGITRLWGISTSDNPIFYFYFPKTGHIKCYRPYEKDKRKKWINNCDNFDDIQGWDQLDILRTKPKFLIITKAMKEVMFYHTFHIHSIALHGERHRFKPETMNVIKSCSKYQLSIMDNDFPGRRAALIHRADYQIPIFLFKEAKNITDLWETKPILLFDYINRLKENILWKL